MARKTIVVFYFARHWLPLRATNEAHLLCWRRYSKHRVVYVNVGFGVPWSLLGHLPIDAVIFDTIFLSMHWSPEYFKKHATPCFVLKNLNCLKIAIPQDEFVNMDVVVAFLNEIGTTHVLSCSDAPDWPRIYKKLDRGQVSLRTVLTGYVDETQIKPWIDNPPSRREIDIGYRAWENPYWLGEHGLKKVEIGQVVGTAARKRGLKVDINNPASTDFLVGAKWFEFLSRCRAVLGVEGGASVLDSDGSIQQRVNAFVRAHPNATFAETREHCFPTEDHAINLSCLSPRHFEACITGTCQILLEGNYNGIFEPWKHYIPIKSDYSNVEEALDALEDGALVDRIAMQAYNDLVASGKWTYRSFVQDIEQTIIDPVESTSRSFSVINSLDYWLLRLRDFLLWQFACFEASPIGKQILVMLQRGRRFTPSRLLSHLKRAISS